MYICMNIHMHTHMHVYMYLYMYKYIYVYTHTHTHTHTQKSELYPEYAVLADTKLVEWQLQAPILKSPLYTCFMQ